MMSKHAAASVWIALAGLALPVFAAQAEPSLCLGGERVMFSCQLRDSRKIVSLCASRDLSAGSGYLQYRFGSPRTLELAYPSQKVPPKGRFTLVHTQHIRSGEYGLAFTHEGVDYALSYIAEGPDGSSDRYTLFVTRPHVDAPVFTDNCSSRPSATNAFYPLERLSKALGTAVVEKEDDSN